MLSTFTNTDNHFENQRTVWLSQYYFTIDIKANLYIVNQFLYNNNKALICIVYILHIYINLKEIYVNSHIIALWSLI